MRRAHGSRKRDRSTTFSITSGKINPGAFNSATITVRVGDIKPSSVEAVESYARRKYEYARGGFIQPPNRVIEPPDVKNVVTDEELREANGNGYYVRLDPDLWVRDEAAQRWVRRQPDSRKCSCGCGMTLAEIGL